MKKFNLFLKLAICAIAIVHLCQTALAQSQIPASHLPISHTNHESVNTVEYMTGDYRTIDSGAWEDFSIWEVFNGLTFESPTELPGYHTGIYIQPMHSVILNSSANHAGSITALPGATLITVTGQSFQAGTYSASNGTLVPLLAHESSGKEAEANPPLPQPNLEELPNQTTNAARQSTPKSNIEYKIISAQSGTYGYEVSVDGRSVIRQTTIPGREGNLGFNSPELAKQVAELVIQKMSNSGQSPTISQADLKAMGL